MELNLLYAINEKYIDIMLVSITSLLLNNKSYKKIKFHIICSNFSIADYQRIDSYLKKYDNVDIEYYPLENFDINKFNIPNWHGNQTANARLFYQSILKLNNVSKLLYLDADTIVVGDLKDLNNSKDTIMAVKDSCLNSYLKYLKLSNYYNSGVLLFDVNLWEKNLCEEQIIKYLKETKKRAFSFPDQDVLNLALSEIIKPLEYKYNIGPYALLENQHLVEMYYNKSLRQIEYKEIQDAQNDPKIYHSYGLLGIKPWMNNNFNPLNDEFMKYMQFIDQSYRKENLVGLKSYLNNHKELFYFFLVTRSFIPPNIEKEIRKLSKNNRK